MRQQDDRASIANRQERAASRILDDESLRDSLTDDEFQPLLDWALSTTDALAESTTHVHDDAADAVLDAGIQAIREVAFMVQEVVAAHAGCEAPDRRDALLAIGNLWTRDNPLKLDNAALHEIRQRLGALADLLDTQPDMTGEELSARITAALSPEKRP